MSHSFRKQQQESYSAYLSLGFLQRQLCKRQLFRQKSTVDCEYLLFIQDFFFRLKPKQCKKFQYC